MVVWGTPNDDGLASVSKNRDYSNSLAQLMTGIVETSIHRLITFDYHYIKALQENSWAGRALTPSPSGRGLG
jgi:hypothetical protein